MNAIFNNTQFELAAAARRAGLRVVAKGDTWDNDSIQISSGTAEGSTHAVMRLIGAVADDGQGTLISVGA